VIFRKSRNAAAAWKLIEYLSRPDVQRRFHALTGDLPPRRSAWSEGALADDVYARAFREQLERAKPTPQVPEWERIANEIRLVTEQVVHGNLTVAQGEAELDARADRILEKRRWLLVQEARRPRGGSSPLRSSSSLFFVLPVAAVVDFTTLTSGTDIRLGSSSFRNYIGYSDPSGTLLGNTLFRCRRRAASRSAFRSMPLAPQFAARRENFFRPLLRPWSTRGRGRIIMRYLLSTLGSSVRAPASPPVSWPASALDMRYSVRGMETTAITW
jgi:hypothetical protein